MSNLVPTHLKSNHLTPDDNFEDTEKLFRKYIPNKTYPVDDYFSEIPSKDFILGLSTNRSKYCSNPEDVLWSIKFINDECVYSKKEGAKVIYTLISYLQNKMDEKNRMRPLAKHTPTICNYSHTDILFEPALETNDRKKINDLKLFLASLFKEVNVGRNDEKTYS